MESEDEEMTKKIVKKIVKGITDKIECNTADIDDWAEFWGFTREEYEEFLDIPLKALEQEPVLDKIRAEIERNAYPIVSGVNKIEQGMTLYEILQVIDKYKTESEVNNG